MADLTMLPNHIVPLLDQDGTPLAGMLYGVTSSDNAVARPGDTGGAHWGIVSVAVGTATINVVRHSDGESGTDKTVEVTAEEVPDFEWSFGTPVPGVGF